MLLFYGETSTTPQKRPPLPEAKEINDLTWRTIQSPSTTIRYCDLSPNNPATLTEPSLAVGVAGKPVFACDGTKQDLLQRLGREALQRQTCLIDQARGVFCGFALDSDSDQLALFTDYLGLRQIFLYKSETFIAFANTQWLIEKLIPKDTPFDEQAVIELGVLGYPLDNRTRRKGVSLLPAGTLLRVEPLGKSEFLQYCNLTSTSPTFFNQNDALEELHSTWQEAVKIRVSDTAPLAFLSGGMDSRLLVHTLKSNNTLPQTANFAPPGTMDRVYAETVAEKLGVPLWLHPDGNPNIDFVADTVEAWANAINTNTGSSTSRTIWSGDGGSVGMGNVYLDDEMVDLCEQGEFGRCASHFCKVNNRNVVSRAYKNKKASIEFESRITSLLEGYARKNPGRAPYYFLMLNDQRRHLDRHYESIHLRRFDFELPFFDRHLIELIASMPTKAFNMHRMYHALYMKINGKLTAAPWQTYPNHVPCPLPHTGDLAYQWGGKFYNRSLQIKKRNKNAWSCLKLALQQTQGRDIFNTKYLIFASVATLIGFTDHSYLNQCIYPTK